MPTLRVQIPGGGATVFHLYKKITSLGSSPECDVTLPDPLVPESFAHIHFDGQVYTIATTSRRHEVSINGKKRKKHRLTHDDRIVIGAIELRFSLLDEAPPIENEAAETMADLDAYQKLYEFSARLLQKHDLTELLDELMDSVIEITNADKGFLVLMEGDQLDVKVARNLKRENIADAVTQLSDSIVAKVIETRRPVIISDAMNDDEFSSSQSIIKLRLTSVICVPLLEKGNLIGIIYVGNDSVVDLFQDETMRVLTVFAAQASLIISNALLLNELKVDNQQLQPPARGAQLRRDRRHQPADAGGVPQGRQGRGDRHLGAHHRRDRHRQGAHRARDPPPLAAPRPAPSSPSTAAPSRRTCSRASCSAT